MTPGNDKDTGENKSYVEAEGIDKQQESLPKSTIYVDTRNGSMNTHDQVTGAYIPPDARGETTAGDKPDETPAAGTDKD